MKEDVARLVKRLDNPPFGTETSERLLFEAAASTIRALAEKYDAKDEECSHAWACWQEERDRVNAMEIQVHEQAAEIERLRDKRDEMSVEAARLFELHRQAEAKFCEAVEVIARLERQVEGLQKGNADLSAANRDRRSKTAHLTHAEQRETNERRRADEAEKKLSQAVKAIRNIDKYSNDTLIGDSENAGTIGWYRSGFRTVREITRAFLASIDAERATMEKNNG